MAENQDSNLETVQVEEVAYWNMIQNEAFLRLLVDKGITTKDEFLSIIYAVNDEFQGETGERKEEGI